MTLFMLCGMLSLTAQQKLNKLSKSVNVSKDVTIDLNTSHVQIEIDTWNKNTVEVEAYIESDKLSKEELKKALDDWNVEVDGSGNLVTIASNGNRGSWDNYDFNFNFDALKDLEIRGAGNLLGGEQSGHIAEVGFDLYMRMVADAVDEFKTGYFDEKPKNNECKVELPINAHLPVEYIESERLRLDLYRRIADAHDDMALSEINSELIDRFGTLPDPTKELLSVASLRLFAKTLGLRDIAISGKNLRLAPVSLPESAQLRLARLYPGSIYKNANQILLVARPSGPNWIESASVGNTSLLAWVEEVLRTLIQPTLKSKSE